MTGCTFTMSAVLFCITELEIYFYYGITDTMETDIVIVDTEETNTLIRKIMETDILAEDTRHGVT